MWWRFSEYEIRHGLICHKRGASLRRYDPWKAYERARRPNGGHWRTPGGGPHEDLVTLARELESDRGTEGAGSLTGEGESALLKWCGTHGLLGVLPHRAIAATICRGTLEHAGMLWPHRIDQVRSSGRWRSVEVSESWVERDGQRYLVDFPPPRRPSAKKTKRESPARRPAYNPTGWQPSRVVIVDIDGSAVRTEPLGSSWAQFFPVVPTDKAEHFPYPTLLSPEFWDLYAEPVEQFLEAAGMIGRVMACLAARRTWDEGMRLLNALLDPVAPGAVGRGGGQAIQAWASPSLLGMFAVMVLRDLLRGRRALTCLVCGTPYSSEVARAQYCSTTCRNTKQKRRYRDGLRKARRAREVSAGEE